MYIGITIGTEEHHVGTKMQLQHHQNVLQQRGRHLSECLSPAFLQVGDSSEEELLSVLFDGRTDSRVLLSLRIDNKNLKHDSLLLMELYQEYLLLFYEVLLWIVLQVNVS
jgi:hypothetical protein